MINHRRNKIIMMEINCIGKQNCDLQIKRVFLNLNFLFGLELRIILFSPSQMFDR